MNQKFEFFVEIYDQKYEIVIEDKGCSLKFGDIYHNLRECVKIGINEDISFLTHEFEIIDHRFQPTGRSLVESDHQLIKNKSLIHIRRRQLLLLESDDNPLPEQMANILEEEEYLLRCTDQIITYKQIVTAIQFVWEINKVHSWDKVCEQMKVWLSVVGHFDKDRDYVKALFFKWTQYYIKKFNKLDGKIRGECQPIFDLLKCIHTLDSKKIETMFTNLESNNLNFNNQNNVSIYENIRALRTQRAGLQTNITQNQNLNQISRPFGSLSEADHRIPIVFSNHVVVDSNNRDINDMNGESVHQTNAQQYMDDIIIERVVTKERTTNVSLISDIQNLSPISVVMSSVDSPTLNSQVLSTIGFDRSNFEPFTSDQNNDELPQTIEQFLPEHLFDITIENMSSKVNIENENQTIVTQNMTSNETLNTNVLPHIPIQTDCVQQMDETIITNMNNKSYSESATATNEPSPSQFLPSKGTRLIQKEKDVNTNHQMIAQNNTISMTTHSLPVVNEPGTSQNQTTVQRVTTSTQNNISSESEPANRVIIASTEQVLPREQLSRLNPLIKRLIEGEKDIQTYHSIVMAINIGWDLKISKNWNKVSQQIEIEKQINMSNVLCHKHFNKWTRFYSWNYFELDGKVEPRIQQIFDLLKIVHILDLDKIYQKSDSIISALEYISKRPELTQYFTHHLEDLRLKKIELNAEKCDSNESVLTSIVLFC